MSELGHWKSIELHPEAHHFFSNIKTCKSTPKKMLLNRCLDEPNKLSAASSTRTQVSWCKRIKSLDAITFYFASKFQSSLTIMRLNNTCCPSPSSGNSHLRQGFTHVSCQQSTRNVHEVSTRHWNHLGPARSTCAVTGTRWFHLYIIWTAKQPWHLTRHHRTPESWR